MESPEQIGAEQRGRLELTLVQFTLTRTECKCIIKLLIKYISSGRLFLLASVILWGWEVMMNRTAFRHHPLITFISSYAAKCVKYIKYYIRSTFQISITDAFYVLQNILPYSISFI